MQLSDRQRRFLKSADSDGRVFVGRRPDRETQQLIEHGYLTPNAYNASYYMVKKKPEDEEQKCPRCGKGYPVYRVVLSRWICESCHFFKLV